MAGEMSRDEVREILDELEEKVRQAEEVAQLLGRGYRQDQINAELTGEEGPFLGDGIPDWIRAIRRELDEEEAAELEERNQEVVEAVNIVGQRLNEEAC